jgi:hypothetical protein
MSVLTLYLDYKTTLHIISIRLQVSEKDCSTRLHSSWCTFRVGVLCLNINTDFSINIQL